MALIYLQEYIWNNDVYDPDSGSYRAGTLIFDDLKPEEVQKSFELPWRVSKLGLASSTGRIRGTKVKWRRSIKVEFSFSGFCNGDKRKLIEYYAQRMSKFKVWYTNTNDPAQLASPITVDVFAMPRPEYAYTSAPPIANFPSGSSYYDRLFVVITSVEFTMSSKPDFYKYNIKLTRVDEKDVRTGYEDYQLQ